MSTISLKSAPLPDDFDAALYQLDVEYMDEIDGGCQKWAGSFNTDTAEFWTTDDSTDRVWLTPSGRWVYTSKTRDCYIPTEWARRWLIANGYQDVATERIDREYDRRGRPEVGPECKVRLPEPTIAAVDKLAARNGLSRAAQLRVIIMDTVALG